MRHPLLLVSLLLYGYFAQAQSGDSGKKRFYLHSILGFQAPDVGPLNAVIEKGGYLSFNRVHFARGAGFCTVFPKIRLASMITFSTFSSSRDEGAQSNWLRGTNVGTVLGITLVDNDRWQLIPFGGLAYSLFGMRVATGVAGNTTFNGYLSGPPNQHHVSANQWMANFGLHLARVPLGSSLGQKLFLGVRGGYYLPLGDTTWKTSDSTLPEGPGSSAGGLYAHLVFGLLL